MVTGVNPSKHWITWLKWHLMTTTSKMNGKPHMTCQYRPPSYWNTHKLTAPDRVRDVYNFMCVAFPLSTSSSTGTLKTEHSNTEANARKCKTRRIVSHNLDPNYFWLKMNNSVFQSPFPVFNVVRISRPSRSRSNWIQNTRSLRHCLIGKIQLLNSYIDYFNCKKKYYSIII